MAIDAISNCVVATGVFAALYQIRSAKEQDAVAFEDKLNIEYREIIRTVDVNVMLGDALPAQNYLSSIYNYFDLCNEQIFLRQRGRVSDRRWDEWIDGMEGNFSLPT
ncbi:MAG TPA: hypothetical protein VJP87_09935, partial [Candidatus Acidoferrales bacterium]|nr:hypothetical protein [Candidatus Acidoferrales bacterium]